MVTKQLPPGPTATVLNQKLMRFLKDPRSFLQQSANAYGDIVHLRISSREIFFINHPNFIQYILDDQSDQFCCCTSSKFKKAFWGTILQPENEILNQNSENVIIKLKKLMGQNRFDYLHCLGQWESGQIINLENELYPILAEILVSVFIADKHFSDKNKLGRLFGELLELQAKKTLIFSRISAPLKQRIRKTKEQIENHFSENGIAPTDTALITESILFCSAAAAKLTTRAIQHILRLPAIENRLHRLLENDEQEAANTITNIFHETTRLYPMIDAIACQNEQVWELSGYCIPAHSTILFSPSILQRDERFHEEPEIFQPERWLGSESAKKSLCLPFGTGANAWLGENTILPLSKALLQKLVTNWRLCPEVDQKNIRTSSSFRMFRNEK